MLFNCSPKTRLDSRKHLHFYHELMRATFENEHGKYDEKRSGRVLEVIYSDSLGYIDFQFQKNKLVSLLMAGSAPRSFQQRLQMVVSVWISTNGNGLPMMRKFLRTIEPNPNLRWLSFMTELENNMRGAVVVAKRFPLHNTRWSQ